MGDGSAGDKFRTFYNTNTSSRLRNAHSQYMMQNHIIARHFNKEYKKIHFKAAQSVQMQLPGVL